VLGSDGESDVSNAVDALLLLYLDAESERAFVLSIPRELYVEVPGYGAAYAGSVYRLGEQEGASGGLVLVQETISATLGLEVNHAALVRFDGFVALIDAIGGVDVDVPAAIEDPAFPDGRGGTGVVVIPAGRQHLDGEQALRYARTRVEPVTGFDRCFRQQQLVLAAHDRLTRLDLLPGLLAQAPAFWSAVSQGLETDLPLSDGIDLALLANRLSSDDIEAVALGDCCVVEGSLRNGERVLLPQPDEITALLNTLLGEER
jgi:LCP family protein required for cell wall assembly